MQPPGQNPPAYQPPAGPQQYPAALQPQGPAAPQGLPPGPPAAAGAGISPVTAVKFFFSSGDWTTNLLLGLVFYALTMLNYSWCLVTTVFAVFAAIMGLRGRWSLREILLRGILPLAIMTVLLTATLVHYRFDYLAAYKVSSAYVGEWYRFTGPRQWLTALFGGQFDILLMSGSVVASAVVVTLTRRRSAGLAHTRPQVLLFVVLGVYVIPLLLGPTALKMETSRCWHWVMSIPVAFAATTLLAQPRRRLFVYGAIAVSTATATVMRLFLNFAP